MNKWAARLSLQECRLLVLPSNTTSLRSLNSQQLCHLPPAAVKVLAPDPPGALVPKLVPPIVRLAARTPYPMTFPLHPTYTMLSSTVGMAKGTAEQGAELAGRSALDQSSASVSASQANNMAEPSKAQTTASVAYWLAAETTGTPAHMLMMAAGLSTLVRSTQCSSQDEGCPELDYGALAIETQVAEEGPQMCMLVT